MTTKVTEAVVQPAVTMDKIHIDSFHFKQKREQNPKREIAMGYCLYGFDDNDNRVFEPKTRAVNEHNMDGTIIKAAVAGGQSLPDFISEYTAHKTDLNTRFAAGEVCDAELMAYFELAMTRVAELNDQITIASVE